MNLIVSRRICEKEFGQAEVPLAERAVILAACHKAMAGLAVAIRGSGPLPKHSQLVKVYATSSRGPRRLLFLVDAAGAAAFLLFYRDKHDAIGRNMGSRNPIFKPTLHRYLALLTADIESGKSIHLED